MQLSSCSLSLSPSLSWLLLRFLSSLDSSRGQLSFSCLYLWLVEGLGFHCLLTFLSVPLSSSLGILDGISTGWSYEYRNCHCLSTLQYPFPKYIHAVLFRCFVSIPLAVSEVIRLMSCLALWVLCLCLSVWNFLLLPSLMAVIWTWCFALILLIVLAPCPMMRPAITAVVSIVSVCFSYRFGVVFRVSMMHVWSWTLTFLSWVGIVCVKCVAISLAHATIPSLLRWYPLSTIIFLSWCVQLLCCW